MLQLIELMKFSWLFLLIIGSASCAERTRGANVKLQINDSIKNFRKEIPRGYGADPKDILRLVSDLKLDNLESGYNISQVRVWLGHSMAKIKTVLLLKKKENGWYGDLLQYSLAASRGNDKWKFREVEKKNDLFPESGWEAFFASDEIQNGIQLLLSSDVEDHIGCEGTDGMGYTFEFADIKHYKLLYVCELNKTYQRFVDKLELEFNFEYIK